MTYCKLASRCWSGAEGALTSIFRVPDVLALTVRLVVFFRSGPWLAARLSRRVRGFHGPGLLLRCRSDGCCWLVGRQGLRAGDRGGDLVGPWPAPGESEPQAAGAAGEASGDGEHAEPEPSGFPAAGGSR